MKDATANLDVSQRPATTPRYNGTGRDTCAAANRTGRFDVLFQRGLVRFVFSSALSEPALSSDALFDGCKIFVSRLSDAISNGSLTRCTRHLQVPARVVRNSPE